MKSRWFQLLITIFIIFSYMQFEYVRYCMECDAGYQEYSYANAVINIVGDRYLILLVSGILIVWSIAGLLAVTRNNFYLKLRIGSEHRANVIEVVYAFKYAVIIAVIQWVEMPRPLVTKPTISSPGTGLQHFEKCTATS